MPERDLSSLSSLWERLAEAKGADRELDARVLCALIAPEGAYVEQSRFNGAWCIHTPKSKFSPDRLWEKPHPWRLDHASATGSNDAALALFDQTLPGWSREVGRSGFGDPAWCRAWNPRRQPEAGNVIRADHAGGSEPHAILLALIEALTAESRHAG